MIQTTFSKISSTAGNTYFINLDNVRYFTVSPDGNHVVIHSNGSKEPLSLVGDDAATFVTDINSFTQG